MFRLLIALVLAATPVFAATEITPEVRDYVLERMRGDFPNPALTPCPDEQFEGYCDEVYPTPIEGLYQIETAGEEILYYHLPTGHLVTGEVYGPDGVNLADPLRERQMGRRWETIIANRDEAVRVGNGPIEVYEIIDPTCYFCRKAHNFWQTRDDVTRYVFLISLEGPESDATWMSEYILGSVDREKALREIMEGDVTKRPAGISAEGEAAFFRMQDFLVRIGIEETPQFHVAGRMLKGDDLKQLVEILEGANRR
jgi:hypothetical protein